MITYLTLSYVYMLLYRNLLYMITYKDFYKILYCSFCSSHKTSQGNVHCFIFITAGITCAHLEKKKLKCTFKCATETWVIVPGLLPNFHQLRVILTLFSASKSLRTRKNRQVYCTWNLGLLEHITHYCNVFFYKSCDYNNKYLDISRYVAG